MHSARKSAALAIGLALMLAGALALGYVRWTRPVVDGDAAVGRGDWQAALAAYNSAERRFSSLPFFAKIVAPEYARISANELYALYRLGRFDEVIDRAERAPDAPDVHLWAGLALLAKARAEKASADAQLGWLARSEQELRRGLDAAPADWDLKYNFELVTRLASELRRLPKNPPSELLQLLRAQPDAGRKTQRPVG